jgi:hypothetical protein
MRWSRPNHWAANADESSFPVESRVRLASGEDRRLRRQITLFLIALAMAADLEWTWSLS